ncbi:hypothetical protein IDM40_18835 [Nocardiopsis sp. HNM0947]|uniref:Uncharacterized protein n=1 Tax=Nocardiopsis coralli TaxID=2772213 RepID=A0ABR9PA63_9ACTN|nr:hypothetical protein [Nocardiopsis coralli]MBE3000736.1 hypothetical protein [Nocardiopsis coralli]
MPALLGSLILSAALVYIVVRVKKCGPLKNVESLVALVVVALAAALIFAVE